MGRHRDRVADRRNPVVFYVSGGFSRTGSECRYDAWRVTNLCQPEYQQELAGRRHG